MAKLTRDDVLHLARLSRLHLSEEEIVRFQTEISTILDYVEQLQGLELDDTAPTYQVTGLKNVMRPDKEVAYGASPKELLKNAPAQASDGHIKVRRVLE